MNDAIINQVMGRPNKWENCGAGGGNLEFGTDFDRANPSPLAKKWFLVDNQKMWTVKLKRRIGADAQCGSMNQKNILIGVT